MRIQVKSLIRQRFDARVVRKSNHADLVAGPLGFAFGLHQFIDGGGQRLAARGCDVAGGR